MNTAEIDYILLNNPLTRRIYKGCFPSDQLPKCRRFPCAMVANLDDSTEQGTHWVALFAPNRKHVYYYDSLAGPTVVNILQYLHENFRKITRIIKPLQARGTSVCGQYAIFFIYMSARGFPPDRIYDLLKSLKHRDRFVDGFVRGRIAR